MTTLLNTTSTTHHDPGAPAARKPSAVRRTVVALTGLLAGFLPVMWSVNIARMLLTGVEAEHQFHQATGQGLLLTALWLGGVAPLVRAGWTGSRPSTSAGLVHLTFVLVGLACAVAAPGGGALGLLVAVAVTGALLWAALPLRPRVRSQLQVDPVLTPVALLAAGLFIPYAVEQVGLQHAATGYHAQNPHFFDMAWLVLVLTVLGLCAASLPSARRLIGWLAAGAVVVGGAGLSFGEGRVFSALALGVGLLAAGAAAARRPSLRSR